MRYILVILRGRGRAPALRSGARMEVAVAIAKLPAFLVPLVISLVIAACATEDESPPQTCIAEVPSCSLCGQDSSGFALSAAWWCEDYTSVGYPRICVRPCNSNLDCQGCDELTICGTKNPPLDWNGASSSYTGTCAL